MKTMPHDPVFPFLDTSYGTLQDGDRIEPGLTKREFFTLHIFSAIIGNPNLDIRTGLPYKTYAKEALEIADVLIGTLGEQFTPRTQDEIDIDQ